MPGPRSLTITIIIIIIFYDTLGYRFVAANSEITEEVEEYIYDEISFIAEFGGALGLFLGFSFYMIWDILVPAKDVLENLLN